MKLRTGATPPIPEAGILVVEGVHLIDVPPGSYEIFCMPLKIKGGDGTPARVILRR